MNTNPPTHSPPVPALRRKSRLLIFGFLVLLVGGVVYYRLRDMSDLARFDSAPLQRIPLNAPFITSPDFVVNKMVDMAGITDRDLVYDLGCGDGRIVISAAMQRGCRGIGFDIDPQRVAEATANAREHAVDNLVTIKQQDVFTLDLKEANVIVVYLLPWMLEKLIPQFEQCPPGTRIVSHDFRIEGIQASQVATVEQGAKSHDVVLYVTPLKKSPNQPKWKNWK